MYHLHNPTAKDLEVFIHLPISRLERFFATLPPYALEQLLHALFNHQVIGQKTRV
jgi:hypothetical protein